MNTHLTMCGRGLLLALPAALMIPTGVAVAQISAGAPAAGAPDATISMAGAGGSQKLRYGKPVTIRGTVNPRAAGKPVRLERALRGRPYRPVAATVTRGDGAFSFKVKATRSGSYRAVMQAGGPATAARSVTVVAKLAASSRRHLLGGRRVGVRGRMLPGLRGRTLRLQLRARGRWRTVDRVRTRSGGRFKAAFRPRSAGVYRLRVRSSGDGSAAAGSDRLPRVYVYRPGKASWYGPGLYGNSTACGGALTAGRLGVAHKYLPCGTRVTFRYRGRSVTAPVIDRGPFAAGRDWDLTAAAKRRLGFGDIGVVWSTR